MSERTTNLRVNGARLWDNLMAMAAIGATPAGGVRRLALTELDRQARARLAGMCRAAGMTVRTDAMGNMFARREGRDPNLAPVLVGSHLDSQPTGGKFDGALGVMGALEIMQMLHETDFVTERPIELVNWTDEEGSRFGHSLMGSGVWAGVYDEGYVLALTDQDGMSVRRALTETGCQGTEPAAAFPADAYFELHIEQGPILEASGHQIGIVTGAQAQIWYDAMVTGTESHAGTTPRSARRDALVSAARVVALVDELMSSCGDAGRGTVGQFSVLPNSRNVIPGSVSFSVEFRHPDEPMVSHLDAEFRRRAEAIAAESNTGWRLQELFRIPAQPFDPDCVDLVRRASAANGFSAREIVSGAAHDAVYVARRVPTAMVFTPCKDGLSHNEAESIEPEQATAGAQVLLEAVLARADRPVTS